jgi:molecular chaperone DnaK
MAQKLYAEQQAAGEDSGSDAGAGPDENIVDAEFEEVDDDDKKSA